MDAIAEARAALEKHIWSHKLPTHRGHALKLADRYALGAFELGVKAADCPACHESIGCERFARIAAERARLSGACGPPQ